jgi:hypothetical protein
VYNYRVVTDVVFDAGFGYDVANAGTGWGVAGGKGVGTDVGTNPLIDQVVSNSWGLQGDSAFVLDFLPAGVGQLNDWATGAASNYGMTLWAVAGTHGFSAYGTRELAGAEPILTLTIIPEPMTIVLLGIGGVALMRRRK